MAPGCFATLSGENFAAAPMVTANCTTGTTPHAETITINASPAPTATSLSLNLAPAAALGAGTICTFHVAQNGVFADGATLVVTNPSSNLGMPAAGADLATARRSPGLVYNGPTSAARYLYVLGGDPGDPANALDTIEFAKVDGVGGGFPTGSAFTQMPIAAARASHQGKLSSGRTYAGAASIGRFIYLVGGYDGTKSVKTVERAEVLDPAGSPQIDDADLILDPSVGLDAGLYFYRVSAVASSSDRNNPGGETLAGDEFAINVPSAGSKKIQVRIAWVLGAGTPADAVGWRIYRTTLPNAQPGSESLVYETSDVSALTLLDLGGTASYNSATLTAQTGGPLPFGAIGEWASPSPQPSPGPASLNSPRAGAGVAVAPDPSPLPSTNTFYLYSGYGYDSVANSFPTSYEYLSVNLTAAGPVESAAGWTQVPIVAGTGRWQLGGFAATSDVDQIAGNTPQIYFGNGSSSATDASAGGVGIFDHGAITPGTGLLLMAAAQSDAQAKSWGYGALTAVNFLFELGGQASMTYLDKNNSLAINANFTLGSFTPQGGGVLPIPLFLPGATVGGAYFWLAGGATGSPSAATASSHTYWVIY